MKPHRGDKGRTISIAIISDLHCHPPNPNPPHEKESFLLTGLARSPANNHPIESLLQRIKEQHLKAQILLCPGDITNRASNQGLQAGIQFLREVQAALKAKHLISSVGNHDVDSRKINDKNPLKLPQTIDPYYPLHDKEANSKFWGESFVLLRPTAGVLVLVINTVSEHTDEASAKRGAFSEEKIEKLKEAISAKDAQIKIALLHHHPLLHSGIEYSNEDVLQQGDVLIDTLLENGFDIIIHGHKHQPRIRRVSFSGKDGIIFAAGSFSAMLKEIGSSTRNLFHMLTISKNGTGDFTASVRTWEYNQGAGWKPTGRVSTGMPPLIRCKGQRKDVSPSAVADVLAKSGDKWIDFGYLKKRLPAIAFMLPDEMRNLKMELAEKHNIKMVFDEETGTLIQVGRGGI